MTDEKPKNNDWHELSDDLQKAIVRVSQYENRIILDCLKHCQAEAEERGLTLEEEVEIRLSVPNLDNWGDGKVPTWVP